MIAFFIKLLGNNPFAWRIGGVLFSAAMIPLIYDLCRRLFKKTFYAALGAIFLACDFMHLTTARIATLEPFSVFFILLMTYFMIRYWRMSFYEDDFKKIDATGKISMLFDAIPAQLNKNASRYQVSSVLTNNRADNTLELIAELKDSKTVLVSYHANDPSAGMSTNKDLTRFKLFLCDTGLFTTLMFKDKDFTENIIYEKLLNDKLGTNLGYLYENVVAQLLTCNGNELFYYTFFNESSRHNYEIDFLIAKKNKVCPIEVKSSGYKTHKSLDEFSIKFSNRILQKYLVYTKDFSKDKDILCLPAYMISFL